MFSLFRGDFWYFRFFLRSGRSLGMVNDLDLFFGLFCRYGFHGPVGSLRQRSFNSENTAV